MCNALSDCRIHWLFSLRKFWSLRTLTRLLHKIHWIVVVKQPIYKHFSKCYFQCRPTFVFIICLSVLTETFSFLRNPVSTFKSYANTLNTPKGSSSTPEHQTLWQYSKNTKHQMVTWVLNNTLNTKKVDSKSKGYGIRVYSYVTHRLQQLNSAPLLGGS